LAIVAIFICIGAYYYYININKNNSISKEKKLNEFDKIIELASENKEFENPDELIIRNNRIISYLYGGKAKLEEVETLINIQRNLFDSELLNINPLELQQEKVKVFVEDYKEKGFRIIDIKQTPAQYKDENPNISRIRVIQYTNGETDNYLEYYLRKQVNDTWKILGWETIDEFDI